uniref:Uncharacterized protein n=1 Tax=Anopheles farauti TaxID=69004 RepID=A0A182Q147_9DIPT
MLASPPVTPQWPKWCSTYVNRLLTSWHSHHIEKNTKKGKMMKPEQEPEPVVDDDPVDVPNPNAESYCRFCFSENEVEPLFSADGTQASAELLERIYDCIGIRLTKKEYCPSAICWSCTLTMEEFQCFRKRCLKFDALVRRLRPTIKSEQGYGGTTDHHKSFGRQQDKAAKKVANASSEVRSFLCQYCPRTFKQRMYLDQHMWKHRDRVAAEAATNQAINKRSMAVNGSGNGSMVVIKKEPIVASSTPTPPPPPVATTQTGAQVDRPISCEYCPRKFTRRMYYMQHLRRHKPEERLFRCRHCTRSFTSHMRRVGHERKIHGYLSNPKMEEKDSFSCPKCARVFKHRSSLRMHLLNHDGQLPYACDICNCRFYSVSYLGLHKKRYHGPNAARSVANGTSIPCLYCTRWFLRECDRSSHIKQMHADMHASKASAAGFNEMLADCPPADSEGMIDDPEMLPPNVHEPMMVIKEEEPDTAVVGAVGAAAAAGGGVNDSTASLASLANPGAFQFYCYSCAMPFDTEDMYSEHLDDQHPFGGEQLMDQLQPSSSPVELDENGTKVFRCPYCPKTFTRKWSMTQHIPTHLGRKGYKCEYCPAIFTRNEYLRTHRQRKHPTLPETGTYKCSYCPRLFHKARYKKVHERIAHIKKGDVLPDGDDTEESELVALTGAPSGEKLDESSCSIAFGPSSRASDSFDQTSNDAHSVAESGCGSVQPNYSDLEASARLVVVLERMPPELVEQYRWQMELYANMTPEELTAHSSADETSAVDDTLDGDKLEMRDDLEPAPTAPVFKRKRSKFGITLHPCPHCSKLFKTRGALRLHALYHSGELPHRCDECGVQFMRYNQLEYHKTRYHGVNSATMAARYSCDYCPRIFLRKQDRTTHQMMVHARDHADAIDVSPGPTRVHSKSKRKDYVCRTCDEEFDTYRICQRHIFVQHPAVEGGPAVDKPMKLCHCSICNGIYKKRDDWHEHLNNHPSVRPHHCEQCIRRRRKASSRKQVHRCSYCPKAFEHKPNLASHLRIHKQQLRFPCTECGVMYDRYRDLLAHQSRYHSQDPADGGANREPLQKCNFCPRVFTRLRDVKYHQEQVHADQAIPIEQPVPEEENNDREQAAGGADFDQTMGDDDDDDNDADNVEEEDDELPKTFGFGPEMFLATDEGHVPKGDNDQQPIKPEPEHSPQ